MTTVVGIRQASRDEAIAALEDLIKKAKTDKSFEFVGYWAHDDGCAYLWVGVDAAKALGLAARLTHNLNAHWDQTA